MTRWLDDDEQQAWRAWLHAHSASTPTSPGRCRTTPTCRCSDFAVLVCLSEAEHGAAARLRAGQRP